VDRLDVECTFHSVTVPNHVHLLRAQKEGKSDQAIFDFFFLQGADPLRSAHQSGDRRHANRSGIRTRGWRLVQILFLATLALAARSRRELAALAGMFLLGQVCRGDYRAQDQWQPAPALSKRPPPSPSPIWLSRSWLCRRPASAG